MKKHMAYLHMTTSYGHCYAMHRPRLDFGGAGAYEITVTARGTPVGQFHGGTLSESIAKVEDLIAQAQAVFEVQKRDPDGAYIKQEATA